MDTTGLSDLQLITGIGQNLTVTVVLLWAVISFMRGDIVSKKTVEMIVASVMEKIHADLDTRFDKLEKKIDKHGGW